jgi:hypothetical protein
VGGGKVAEDDIPKDGTGSFPLGGGGVHAWCQRLTRTRSCQARPLALALPGLVEATLRQGPGLDQANRRDRGRLGQVQQGTVCSSQPRCTSSLTISGDRPLWAAGEGGRHHRIQRVGSQCRPGFPHWRLQ